MEKAKRYIVTVEKGFWFKNYTVTAASGEEAVAEIRRAAPWPSYVTFKARPAAAQS